MNGKLFHKYIHRRSLLILYMYYIPHWNGQFSGSSHRYRVFFDSFLPEHDVPLRKWRLTWKHGNQSAYKMHARYGLLRIRSSDKQNWYKLIASCLLPTAEERTKTIICCFRVRRSRMSLMFCCGVYFLEERELKDKRLTCINRSTNVHIYVRGHIAQRDSIVYMVSLLYKMYSVLCAGRGGCTSRINGCYAICEKDIHTFCK